MPRENKTKYALLGFLAYGPKSGYDIKKSIEESLGHFWSESYGQIYPILKKLEAEGLASSSLEHQQGKPSRNAYTITEAGREVLHQWLEQPAEPHRYRLEVLVKLLFGRHAPQGAAREHVQRFRAEHAALLQQYDAIEKALTADHASEADLPYWMLTVRCGQRVSRAYLEWCDEADAMLQSMTGKQQNPRGRGERPGVSRNTKGGAS